MGMFINSEEAAKLGGLARQLQFDSHVVKRRFLIGQISATKTTDATVTEAAMASPRPKDHIAGGHRPEGRTVCIHAVAVAPEFQMLGLGRRMLTAYVQHLKQKDMAHRVAILAHAHLLGYYESFGFVNMGLSKNPYGNGGWYDMILDLHSSTAAAAAVAASQL